MEREIPYRSDYKKKDLLLLTISVGSAHWWEDIVEPSRPCHDGRVSGEGNAAFGCFLLSPSSILPRPPK